MGRLFVWALVVAGCGRVGFSPQQADGAIPDAPPDAPPDAAPVLVETVTVPSDGTTVRSTTTLGEGVAYILVASGTFTAVPPAVDPMADAEYYDMTDPNGGPKDIDTSNMIDFGLAIDTPAVGMTKTPASWGTYRDDHTYTVPFTGTGKRLSATIFDCCYGDNVGTLSLQIFAAP